MNDLSKDLIPTKEETMEILSQVTQAQKEQPDPMKVPVTILQAWVGRVVLKAFNRVEGKFNESFDEFVDGVEKIVKRLEDEANR